MSRIAPEPAARARGPAADTARTGRLVLDRVAKRFTLRGGGAVEAIRDVSFSVATNELCVLLGPSGCGKSTVLRMIAGLDRPSAGHILLDDREIRGPGRDRGMVFQAYTSFDWLTVQANVEYGMRLHGVPRAERSERARRFIRLVGLGGFEDAWPAQLSGGMKQRVAIARTLAVEPEILLMDEPFGALDAQTRWTMQELLVSVLETTPTTAILVTHDIEEAIYLADRIVFLSRRPGRVREILVPEFKQGRRFATKEAMLEDPGYARLERRIMRMMREEVAG
jgi:NitT/TauT family transport system ATP-binding protein